jgi:MFS family permease
MQVPSNMFINTISRPSLYISIIMLLWGMVSTLSGATHNFAGMVATRFFLGFVEAAFLPGALMVSLNAFLFTFSILSQWTSSTDSVPTDPLKVVHAP